MKVYIVTESRASDDLYDQAEDDTNIVAVFAKSEDAVKCVDIRINEITAEFAGCNRETDIDRLDNGGATVTVYNDGDFEYEFELCIREEEVRG